MEHKKCVAVILAAGQGKRMKTRIQKQYLLLDEKPILYYSLNIFQKCSIITEIILVVASGENQYCREEIINKYGFDKVTCITEGGAERYHSVYNGLKCIKECDYVFIHDGARPFVDESMIQRGFCAVQEYDACVVGMPVKDTIKIADDKGFCRETPNRDFVWLIQTPQVFSYTLIMRAYKSLMQCRAITVTDDAMVVETMENKKVKLIPGSYENIKITTPEDLEIAGIILDSLTD